MDGIEVIAGHPRVEPRADRRALGPSDGDDKVDALDAGADDYVTKPFDMDELLARVRAAARRGALPGADGAPGRRRRRPSPSTSPPGRVTRDGEQVRLTPTECHLLEVLVRNAGRLVPQQQLLHEVWGPGYDKETHYLRVYVAQLRRKLEVDPASPVHIVTEPGLGYRIDLA